MACTLLLLPLLLLLLLGPFEIDPLFFSPLECDAPPEGGGGGGGGGALSSGGGGGGMLDMDGDCELASGGGGGGGMSLEVEDDRESESEDGLDDDDDECELGGTDRAGGAPLDGPSAFWERRWRVPCDLRTTLEGRGALEECELSERAFMTASREDLSSSVLAWSEGSIVQVPLGVVMRKTRVLPLLTILRSQLARSTRSTLSFLSFL